MRVFSGGLPPARSVLLVHQQRRFHLIGLIDGGGGPRCRPAWCCSIPFSPLNDLINLFVPSDNSSSGTRHTSDPAALPLLISHFSLRFLPALVASICSASLYPPQPPPTPTPPSLPPFPLVVFPLYRLIAHNHRQSVSVTNRPIRVGRSRVVTSSSSLVYTICFILKREVQLGGKVDKMTGEVDLKN